MKSMEEGNESDSSDDVVLSKLVDTTGPNKRPERPAAQLTHKAWRKE